MKQKQSCKSPFPTSLSLIPLSLKSQIYSPLLTFLLQYPSLFSSLKSQISQVTNPTYMFPYKIEAEDKREDKQDLSIIELDRHLLLRSHQSYIELKVSGSESVKLFSRTSPGADKGLRKQRRKKVGGRRRDAENFVKIENCCPSPAGPFQGLWKGICESMCLDFCLVTYDDVGGITCQRVGDSREPFSGISPVFWTSNTTFLNSPFSGEEDRYVSCQHVALKHCDIEKGVVSRILCINSFYDSVLPNLSGSSGDHWNVEGRIWEYEDETLGFGFLRNTFIVYLKHITKKGSLLDSVEYCSSSSSSSISSSSNRNSSPSP